MKKLGFRLFLAMALLAAISVSIVSLLGRKATHLGFVRIGELEQQVLDESMQALGAHLTKNWQQHGQLDALELELERLAELLPAFRGVALVTPEGRLVTGVGLPSESMRFEVGPERVEGSWGGQGDGPRRLLIMGADYRIHLEGHGELVLVPLPERRPHMDRRKAVLGGVDRGLLYAGLGVMVLALGFSALLARRIVRPLAELTLAVRDLEVGDLSRRVETRGDDELAALGEAFNDMASSLEHSEALRQRIVTDVAHELRTPLTILQGRVEAAQDGLLDTDAAFLDNLHIDILHLNELVSDLQDLALAEAGELQLEPLRLDVAEELERLAASLGLDASSRPALELRLADGLHVHADPLRFRQIFQNLLGNARTHAPEGRIVVSTRALGPEQQAGSETREVEITVADNGTGIAPEDLPNIFDRFYRADASRQRKTGGHGLGLGIVRQLAELHGGRATAESELGQGSRFRVVLPASRDLTHRVRTGFGA